MAIAAERLKGLPAQVVKANFRDAAQVLDALNIPTINGALLDLAFPATSLTRPAAAFPTMPTLRLICG